MSPGHLCHFPELAMTSFVSGLRSIAKAANFKATDEDMLHEECWKFDDDQ